MKLEKSLIAVSAIAALLALGACGKNDNQTAGQKLDSAVATTEQKASEAKADMKDAAAEAKTDIKDAAQDAKVAIANTGDKIADKLDDATITAEVNAGLAKDATLSALKINVDTQAGKVTLRGPAPSSLAKERATEIAKAVKGVSAVDNQLTIQSS